MLINITLQSSARCRRCWPQASGCSRACLRIRARSRWITIRWMQNAAAIAPPPLSLPPHLSSSPLSSGRRAFRTATQPGAGAFRPRQVQGRVPPAVGQPSAACKWHCSTCGGCAGKPLPLSSCCTKLADRAFLAACFGHSPRPSACASLASLGALLIKNY